MIDPRHSVRTILDARPDFAAPLFDLVLWVAEEMKTASDRAVFDEVLEGIYAKTDDAREGREQYKDKRKRIDEPLILTPSARS